MAEQDDGQRERQLYEYAVGLIKSGYSVERMVDSLMQFGVDRPKAIEIIRLANARPDDLSTQKVGERIKSIQAARKAARNSILAGLFIGFCAGMFNALIRSTGNVPPTNIVVVGIDIVGLIGGILIVLGIFQWFNSQSAGTD